MLGMGKALPSGGALVGMLAGSRLMTPEPFRDVRLLGHRHTPRL